jgi:PAS domain S-box-containing protein
MFTQAPLSLLPEDERTRADGAVVRTAALQSAIFNSSNFASIATDLDGTVQLFSLGAERMLGFAAADVVRRNATTDFVDPTELALLASQRSIELGRHVAPDFGAMVCRAGHDFEDLFDIKCIRADGSQFPAVFSVTMLHDVHNVAIGYLLVGTDDSARKAIEVEQQRLDQQLRDQHFYTRSLIESSSDAMMMTDTRGFITDVNKQTETLSGCTRDELIGAPFRNYFTEPIRADNAIGSVLRDGKVADYELVSRARDGTLTDISCNATTFHDRDRRLLGVIASARDMTEVKRFEAALQQKNVQLEEASRLKSEFLANMSHELRTPLNAIIGFSEVLMEGLMGDLTDQQRAFIGDIFDSGNHLLELINDILDLSKVEAGKMTLDLESVAVASLLGNTLSIIREKAATRRIRLALVDTTDALGFVRLDTRKVKQVIFNLLSNAVKFTGERGHVVLRASRVPHGDVGQLSGGWYGRCLALTGDVFDEYLRISVTDSGIGMAPDSIEQIFRPFSQVDSGLARKFEGTGLGLALVKLMIELHGGTVAVQSAVGEGSCFTVWLPCREAVDDPTPLEFAPPIRLGAGSGAPVALVVEDDPKSSDLLRVHLESEGFQVIVAPSAEAALEHALQHSPALITLDIMLPNMDGWDFLTSIKHVPTLCSVPVVIISVIADHSKGFALGAAAIMQKPVSRRELCDSLVGLGLFPRAGSQQLKVLVVDDDRRAVELISVRLQGLASTILSAHGGAEAIDVARAELPDLIVLDLMMPDVSGFDVVDALNLHADTARIPILVVTAKELTPGERNKLHADVSSIMQKGSFDRERLTAEVRRAMSGRHVVT